MLKTEHAGWLAVASVLTSCGDNEDRLRCGEGTHEVEGECVPEDTNTDSGEDTGSLPATEDCNDGIDNDGDDQIDCADLDCSDDPQCDVDGDGLEDVLIGGYRGPDWSGVAYLVTGG